MEHPPRFTSDGLPARVTIYEVGPRDGLQNEPGTVALATKLEFIRRLGDAGLGAIEVTSLVRPDRVPQLADADELLRALPRDGRRRVVLVPNARGLDRALELGVGEIAVFASATETFAQANLNRSRDESLGVFSGVVKSALAAGVEARGYISMCFGDPWEGEVAIADVVGVAESLFAMGCHEVSLGDTIGVATPGHVEALYRAVAAAGIELTSIAAHFHDTYGQALANTLVALGCGVTTVDASAGGLGGCPFAKSATGNLATEDLLWQLEGLGIDTGVDLGALVRTSVWLSEQLGRPSPSRAVTALAKEFCS